MWRPRGPRCHALLREPLVQPSAARGTLGDGVVETIRELAGTIPGATTATASVLGHVDFLDRLRARCARGCVRSARRFLAPWPMRVRLPRCGSDDRPVDRARARAPPRHASGEVGAVESDQGDVELTVDEIDTGRRARRITLASQECAPSTLAKFDGWMALRTTLLMIVDHGYAHVYGPDGAVTDPGPRCRREDPMTHDQLIDPLHRETCHPHRHFDARAGHPRDGRASAHGASSPTEAARSACRSATRSSRACSCTTSAPI